MGDPICKQHSYFDAARTGLLLVDLGHVGDGVGRVGAMADVDDGRYVVLEVLYALPVSEGLFCDNVTAVLQKSHPEAQAAAGLKLHPLESVHQGHGKLLLLLMVVLGALRAVQQKGQLQATVLIWDCCVHTEQGEELSNANSTCFTIPNIKFHTKKDYCTFVLSEEMMNTKHLLTYNIFSFTVSFIHFLTLSVIIVRSQKFCPRFLDSFSELVVLCPGAGQCCGQQH